MKFYDIEQRSDKWRELRRGKFTASIIKNLFAQKKSAAYYNSILQVVYERLTGDFVESFSTPFMERGIELEPFALKEYETLSFNDVSPGGFFKLNSYVGGSPDGRIKDVGLVEVKCPKYSTHIKYLLSGKLPPEYKYQCYSNLYISKMEWLDFMSFHPNLESLVIRIFPDDEIFSEIETELNTAIKEVKKIIRKLKNKKGIKKIKVIRTKLAA